MFIPIYLCLVLAFGGGFVAAKGNVGAGMAQSLFSQAAPQAPAAAK